jgi:hypothetical protein
MWPVTSEHGGKVDRGPFSESMYTACSTHLTMGLACRLSITREYMEHGGRLAPNCVLTGYYLPVYPPYSDSNYGLRRKFLEGGFLTFFATGCTQNKAVWPVKNGNTVQKNHRTVSRGQNPLKVV